MPYAPVRFNGKSQTTSLMAVETEEVGGWGGCGAGGQQLEEKSFSHLITHIPSFLRQNQISRPD